MCVGGKQPSTPAPVTPAPPPAPPAPAPEETAIGASRRQEEVNTFGSSTPTMRVDRSASGGGVGKGGSGIKM